MLKVRFLKTTVAQRPFRNVDNTFWVFFSKSKVLCRLKKIFSEIWFPNGNCRRSRPNECGRSVDQEPVFHTAKPPEAQRPERLRQKCRPRTHTSRGEAAGGVTARTNVAEVSTKNTDFSPRGPAKAPHTTCAEGASCIQWYYIRIQKSTKPQDFYKKNILKTFFLYFCLLFNW